MQLLRTSEHEEVRDGDRRMATPPHSTALLEDVEEGVDEVQGTPKAWNVRESSLAVDQYEEIILAHGKQLDSKHDPNEQSPKIPRMDQVGGRLPLRRHAHRNIGNRPLRIRTVGGVGGRRRDCPAPPTRFGKVAPVKPSSLAIFLVPAKGRLFFFQGTLLFRSFRSDSRA